jgi:alkylation response protein AidB-like acyl-CoA dehydrogenase
LSFQGISFKLADMATEIAAADLLLRKSCDMKERGEKPTLFGAMAKYYGSEVSVRVSTDAGKYLVDMATQKIFL